MALGLLSPVASSGGGSCTNLPDFDGSPGVAWVIRGGEKPGDSLLLDLSLTGVESVELPEGCVLKIPGQAAALEAGGPDVPAVARLFNGWKGARARLGSVESEYEEIPGFDLAPAESPKSVGDDVVSVRTPTFERVRNPARYESPGFWPADLLSVQEAWMGTQKFVRVECRPVQYDPVRQVVRLHRQIRATVRFEPESGGGAAP